MAAHTLTLITWRYEEKYTILVYQTVEQLDKKKRPLSITYFSFIY